MTPPTRRTFLAGSIALAGSAVALGETARALPAIDRSPQTLPDLPYAPDALAPVISARTVALHHGKHHQGYFTNLAKLLAGTDLASASLEDVMLATAGDPARQAIFNNAAQAWNHNLYWQSLSPRPGAPSTALAGAIARDFGSRAALEAELAKTATGQFGSGWAWLATDGTRLRTMATHDAGNPMTEGWMPLLVIDVWEHAYYLDSENRRADYVQGVIARLLDWGGASARLARLLPGLR